MCEKDGLSVVVDRDVVTDSGRTDGKFKILKEILLCSGLCVCVPPICNELSRFLK